MPVRRVRTRCLGPLQLRVSPSDGDEPDCVEQVDAHTRPLRHAHRDASAHDDPEVHRGFDSVALARVTTARGGYMVGPQPAGCVEESQSTRLARVGPTKNRTEERSHDDRGNAGTASSENSK